MWLWLRIALTALALLMGYYYGSRGKKTTASDCPSAVVVSSMETNNGKAMNSNFNSPCQGNSQLFDHCSMSYGEDRTFLHLYQHPSDKKQQLNIPDKLFPNLHHPASPAKTSYVITTTPHWIESPSNYSYQTSALSEFDPLSLNCNQIYLTRTGQRANQPNKCVAIVSVPRGVASTVQITHRIGYTALKTNQYTEDYFRTHSFQEEFTLLWPTLRELNNVRAEFLSKMGNPMVSNQQQQQQEQERRSVTIMVANDGVFDLLLNFLCSAEGAGVDLNNIMVFVGKQEGVAMIEAMGAHAMYSPVLGSMPTNAAGGYLDSTFGRMMWFKTTSVYIALTAGFHVLFQDVDLAWLRDPVSTLQLLDGDIIFMDDGARTPRYTPFFVNSGFYFVKHNERNLYFMEHMLKSGAGEIAQTHSHQSTLVHIIAETVHLLGLKVLVLDMLAFPSGQVYHENKPFIKKMIAREVTPFVFHMCWTENRENKVVYFKEINMWFLPEEKCCREYKDMLVEFNNNKESNNNNKNMLNRCCVRSRYWKNTTSSPQ